MGFQIENFADPDLDVEYLTYLVDRHWADLTDRCQRYWDYFRNTLVPAVGVAASGLNASSRPYFQAQEVGLPPRITGLASRSSYDQHLTDLRRKEVVIENDIAWRVNTGIDFLFGKPPVIRSLAADAALARTIERVITEMLQANGGMGFLQEMALYGAVYGFVDIALRTPAGGRGPQMQSVAFEGPTPSQYDAARRPDGPAAGVSSPDESGSGSPTPPALPHPAGQPAEGLPPAPEAGRPGTPQQASLSRQAGSGEQAVAWASTIQLEPVEATRVLPVLQEDDYRRLRYWVQKYHKHPSRLEEARRGWFGLVRSRSGRLPACVEVVEIIGPTWWQRYEDRVLVDEGPNALGRLPIVHVQNMALPGSYEGMGDVEPLIPLQDELNTRLSDRANRVTYQSFKMYLGKGIDDFLERPVGPGQMWSTANLQASIEEFGSDTGSPSEDAHIEQVRQAMDKVSTVTPLAAGLIRGNVGYLTSAAALRVLLSGLLARTANKRLTYGEGLARIVELALSYLDTLGVLRTNPTDRRIEVDWPSPLPDDQTERLQNAQAKAALGVPAARILQELGYGDQVPRQPGDSAAEE